MTSTQRKNKYVYGPVKSWRSGTSLGIDPIGDISTCSFNCVYCQLGKIQNVTSEVKTYVATQDIIDDLLEFETLGIFSYEELDVITFAGSGEPTIAANLAEIINVINQIQSERIKEGKLKAKVPISILTNATMFNDPTVLKQALLADRISLKLDAPNDHYLELINQPAAGVTMDSIISGIQKFKEEFSGGCQLQMMFMPKYLKDPEYIQAIANTIIQTAVNEIQINTPTRPRPLGKEFHIESRGNHPGDNPLEPHELYETAELPVITKEEAFTLEADLKALIQDKVPNLKFQNVYKKD